MKVKLNLHGVVGVEDAHQIEEEEYEEVVKKPAPEPSAAKVRPDTLHGVHQGSHVLLRVCYSAMVLQPMRV